MGQNSLVFLQCLLLVCVSVASALQCDDSGEFRANSTFSRNRELMFSLLASNVTAEGGFSNASIGQDLNKIYSIALCREGYEAEACVRCVNKVGQDLIKQCPNQTAGFSWDGDNEVLCLVRYSNRSIIGSLELEPRDVVSNTTDITSNLTEFDQIWEGLMSQTVTAASTERSSSRLKYYAVAKGRLTNFQDIYTLMQCSPDISSSDCNTCLIRSLGQYQTCCNGKQGGVVARPSCYFRWDLYSFYGAFDNVTLSPPLPQSPPSYQRNNETNRKESGGISSRTTVAIVIPTVIVVLLIVAFSYALCRRRKSSQEIETAAKEAAAETDGLRSLRFDFGTVKAATNAFSVENKLGQGGFGAVYKGKLPNGEEIAVKRLSIGSGQGETEFKNEVLFLASLQHRNLVKLLGFCLEGNEKLLVYEFVPNLSLDGMIFDSVKSSMLTWDMRYNIIGGIARGLLYLHEDSRLRIIHRDLKPSNILLDEQMNPKISDFGMARLFAADQTQAETHRVMGTYGYMPPEYIRRGHFSVKSDVYSFGILVLEMLSGRKNNSFQIGEAAVGLPAYAWKCWSEGRALDTVDPILRNGSRSEIMRCIHIGLLCAQERVVKRPTMNLVVLWLSSESTSLPVPANPAFFTDIASEPETSTSSGSTRISNQSSQFSFNQQSISANGTRSHNRKVLGL